VSYFGGVGCNIKLKVQPIVYSESLYDAAGIGVCSQLKKIKKKLYYTQFWYERSAIVRTSAWRDGLGLNP
jgi:hypothetical protein